MSEQPMSRESALALIAEADRWRRAYEQRREEAEAERAARRQLAEAVTRFLADSPYAYGSDGLRNALARYGDNYTVDPRVSPFTGPQG